MANTLETAEALFYAGRMNKDLDERFIKQGEYIDALNVRIGSSELGSTTNSDLGSAGAIENTEGNTSLTNIQYVSSDAKCIGAYEDSSNETIYWFVTSTDADLVLSYNVNNGITTNHLVSLSSNPILNFDSKHLINGINKIDDLLFWTDNLNPPRRINVTKTYNNFDESDISVIVAPPMSAPSVSLYNSSGEENYILDKFISFSYRYKYDNGEYSSLSQFADIAFEPGEFELDYTNFTNVGMTNSFNSVLIEFNTGPKQVVGIDVCFKTSDSNIINVIEKFDKSKEGWFDNRPMPLVFTNRKIYTTLLESELLRLYDNVPRTAKAQTSIGNRIMYANYVDGYDVGEIDYSLQVISSDPEDSSLEVTYTSGIPYAIDPTSGLTIPGSNLNIDFSNNLLKKNFVLTIDFNIISDSYSGDSNFDDPPNSPGPGASNNFSYQFSFLLQKDYTSVWDLANSQEFIDAVSTHKPYADANPPLSLTDTFNADKVGKIAVDPYSEWFDINSGITAIDGSFLISASIGSNILGIQCPAVKFRTEFPVESGTFLYGYQYFSNSVTDVYFAELGAKKSLHSNRDYEVAIVYMDDYLRSSTALVDTDNTVFINASNSASINSIRVTLNNLPPSWATKYKFVLKQSVSSYETVYTNLFFKDDQGNTWFRLEGDNRQKVSENQTLIVKKDTIGVVSNLVNTTVLELDTKAEDFISNNENENGDLIIEPAGLYMRLRPSGFTAEYDPNSFRYDGVKTDRDYTDYYFDELNPDFIPGDPIDPENRKYRPFSVPAGSQIKFIIRMARDGTGDRCNDFSYDYEKTFIANQDYENMFEWYLDQGVNFDDGTFGGNNERPVNTQFYTFKDYNVAMGSLYGEMVSNYFFQAENGFNGGVNIEFNQGRLRFRATTGVPCCRCYSIFPVNRKYSRVTLDITVQTGSGMLIFETQPEPSNGEIYYENSQSFDIVTGYHNGNFQNQTSTQPAIIDLDFFNCFTFGNGAESYKIGDSLTGAPFYLGSRVTAVSQEDFKEADRYATITYSGIYNAETNLNKLNEFNLALVNWKDCEKSFGPINVLHARRTDVLVLQEDKVSNVLVGKNLLSDAAGGGAVTSNLEVLGTQIARIEEYGISSNPESFVVNGYDSYFTDTKRNAVLNLKGEELTPISSLGMTNWFRSQFKDRVGYQNIGGYDPYMKEYVLSLNNNLLPSDPIVYNCGVKISQYNFDGTYTFDVELGSVLGDVVIDHNFQSGGADILVVYDGSNVINEAITGVGSNSFYKSSINPTTITVTISAEIASSYDLVISCPVTQEITVVRVVLNSVDNLGETIHNKYKWIFDSISSAYSTDFITMQADGVSLYDADTGMNSRGLIPAFGSTVKMSSNKLTDDTFVFDDNRFKFLVSDQLYTESQVNLLRGELDVALPVLNPSNGNYEASFTYDNPDGDQYLYLVWDYAVSTPISLCYDENSFFEPCSCAANILTVSVTAVGETTATFNGNFINNGGDVNAIRGFVYGTSPNPTTANSVITDTIIGTGIYSLNATGLTNSVKYYVRAYTIVSGETVYGNELNFTTITATVTVGTSGGQFPIWGYSRTSTGDPYFGSITPYNQIAKLNNGRILALTFYNNILKLWITGVPQSNPPINWYSITIGDTIIYRTNSVFGGDPSFDEQNNTWTFLFTSTNILGTTVGIQKTITIV